MIIRNDKEYFRICEIAKDYLLTKAAVYRAVLMFSIPHIYIKSKMYITKQDYKEYFDNRYNKKKSLYKGKPRFQEGEYPVKEAVKMMNISINSFYFRLRDGKFPSIKRGGAYVISQKDIDEHLKSIRS